jgi:hypothetical protein
MRDSRIRNVDIATTGRAGSKGTPRAGRSQAALRRRGLGPRFVSPASFGAGKSILYESAESTISSSRFCISVAASIIRVAA